MHLRLFSVVLLLCGVLVACQKDKDSIPEEPGSPLSMEGFWVGQYTYPNYMGSFNAAILVRPGGTLRFFDSYKPDTADMNPAFKIEGTWAVVDSTFLLTLVMPQFGYSAKAIMQVNATSDTMIGPYQIDGETYGIFNFSK